MADARQVHRRHLPRWFRASLGGIAAVCLSGCEYETREVEIGYLGEARRNPFLAAQRLCETYGLTVETGLSIADLPSHDTTVILASDAVISGGTARLVATWVAEGGSLVYLLDGGSRFRNDFAGSSPAENPLVTPDGNEEETDHLLEYMEVPTAVSPGGEESVWIDDREFDVDIPGDIVFVADWLEGESGFDPYRSRFLDFTYGAGEVYLIADAHPFRNRQIGEKDHAAFFWSIIESTGNASVLIVVGGRMSFFGLLWSRGWMVVVPVLLAVAVWLWKSLPRHGPVQPDEEVSKRDFARHIDMLGQFLWRERATEALLAPVRHRIRLQFRAATGRESERDDEQRFLASLAERSGLSVDRVHQALHDNPEREPARLVQITRDLHVLTNSL